MMDKESERERERMRERERERERETKNMIGKTDLSVPASTGYQVIYLAVTGGQRHRCGQSGQH